jgi:hypothetical protein
MTNKDRAMIIVNKLFELAEKDITVKFTGHLREMVICSGDDHYHICDYLKFKDQLQNIIISLDKIESNNG